MSSITAVRVIFSLGIVNLVTGLLVFFTCRCLPGAKIGKKYPRFYKSHCYYWWAFWVSVIVHAVLALVFIGRPF